MEVESKYIRSLLQNAQNGNNPALEQLFEMNLDRIYTISHRLTGNMQDAETLACKSLIEGWKQLDKIRNDVPFNLWLDGLNVHLALQQLRDSKDTMKKRGLFKKKKTELKEIDSKISGLDKEICKLQKHERTVFVLHKIENYSLDELSVMMDLSLNQVSETLRNAENKLVKAEIIQTRDLLIKKIAELPSSRKANKRIIRDALAEIYEIKLRNKIDEEEEKKKETEEQIEEANEPRESKPEKLRTRRETAKKFPSIDLPSIDLSSFTPGFKKKIGWVLTIIAIVIAAYAIITSSLNDWEAKLQSGTVILGRDQLSGTSSFSADEILRTAENSTARIIIPTVGSISVQTQTELKRLNEKNSAELFKGEIKVDCSGAEDFFTLLIPAAIISNHELGSVYTVDVKADKNGQIFVNDGSINIAYKDKEIIAAANYYVDFDASFGISMPYYKNSDTEFIGAVREFLYTKSEAYVERIVSIATRYNALTLWNLFRFISPAKRILVYRKLNDLVPHPPAITNEDVINLNSDKLQIWLKEIRLNI